MKSTSYAGIAQLVERNLAKVEVASSSLVSRSKFQTLYRGNPFGGMAEWLCSGLQSRVRRFDSDSRLQNNSNTSSMAGWQSDYATVCKAVQAGLNPRPRLQFAPALH